EIRARALDRGHGLDGRQIASQALGGCRQGGRTVIRRLRGRHRDRTGGDGGCRRHRQWWGRPDNRNGGEPAALAGRGRRQGTQRQTVRDELGDLCIRNVLRDLDLRHDGLLLQVDGLLSPSSTTTFSRAALYSAARMNTGMETPVTPTLVIAFSSRV